MPLSSTNNHRRSPLDHDSTPVGTRIRAAAAIAIALLAAAVWLLNAAPTSAFAMSPAPVAAVGTIPSAPSPSTPPAPAPSPSSPTPRTTPPTTIVTDPVGFSPTGLAVVSGTKQPDSSVVVRLQPAGTTACSVPANRSQVWDCGRVLLPNGAGVRLEATETLADTSAPPAPSASTTIDVLSPPILDGTGSYLTTGLVSGSGHPGGSIRVSIDGVVDPNCAAVPVSSYSYWSCNVAAPTGGPYTVRAQQSKPEIGGGRSSDYSNVQRITVDRDRPAAAVITSPRAESRVADQPFGVTGTGEDGASLDVYVDGVPMCSTVVIGGDWACTLGELARGAHELQAVQRDAAGNFAEPSGAVRVFFGPRPPAAPPGAAPAPPALPAPAPGDPAAPAPDPTPSPSIGGGPPVFSGPSGPSGRAPTLPDALTNWGTPTPFGVSLTTIADAFTISHWYTAPLVGLVFLALVAIPLRLLASSLRGRVRLPRGRLTGRNQITRGQADASKPVNPWLAGVVPLAASAALIVLAGGVNGEVRYLRLFLAVALGLTILNLLGAVVATRLGSHLAGVSGRLRFLPIMLVVATMGALLSRAAGFEPPLIAGVLVGAAFATSTPAIARATVNLVQVAAVTALGVAGWLAHGLLGPVEGFWASVASETLATICLAGLGSALVLLLPIATLPGRVILEWSRLAWVGAVLVVASIAASVVVGDTGAALPPAPVFAGAAMFAALSVAVWLFVRYVEPRTRS